MVRLMRHRIFRHGEAPRNPRCILDNGWEDTSVGVNMVTEEKGNYPYR
jgi:hypothetical protein